MQSTGQASTQAVSFVPMQGSAITYAMAVVSPGIPYIAQPNREKQFRSSGAPSGPGATLKKMPAKVRKAVFPAAGLGTRFLPATKAQPKEMLSTVVTST